ncbi:ribosome-associated protein YbcJ (S4-like RNA binding protein) [Arthrobacter pascens]|uniref:hypothetical protein n=1 Tax=Arthrobacter pascens TaxID=1677 RepID=UPI002793BEF3|nr:hypothetical protein [Arthrobacter pascens]MDQ0677405.1 ribosome-associated protein YbcJ (S4-like RNA binding protein) [Arthrobacter pascens]
MSSNLETPIPTRPPTRTMLVVLTGFTAALCWWIGMVGVVNSGGGAQVFLTIPVLATIGTLLAARRRGRQKAKHVSQPPGHARGALSENRRSLVVLSGFTAALCWWIGIVGVVNSGGGAQVFLTIPVLATIGTLLAARYKGRLAA